MRRGDIPYVYPDNLGTSDTATRPHSQRGLWPTGVALYHCSLRTGRVKALEHSHKGGPHYIESSLILKVNLELAILERNMLTFTSSSPDSSS